jgi:hypothetical protein
MLIGFAVFWAITGKESALLVGAAGSLILAAQYERVRDVLRDASKPSGLQTPPEPKDEPEPEEEKA